MEKTTDKYFILDFDSTFIKIEALDLLAEICLANDKNKVQKLIEFKKLTQDAMEGTLPFHVSLKKRLKIIDADKIHLDVLVRKIKREISNSIKSNKEFFRLFAERVYIVSGGFKEYILPVVKQFGIREQNVFANTLKFNKAGKVIGFDEKNPLSKPDGKVKQIKALNLKGELIVIGDGYTDYELKNEKIAHKFYAFTENVSRRNVVNKADHVAPSFDEFLYVSKLPMSISYPKNRIKVLLLENIHPAAIKIFRDEGYEVESIKGSMDEYELSRKIKNVSILGIRSKTRITQNIINASHKLHAIGAFCIGTNQIDTDACLKHGVVVFNAPFSNTRSVVEMVIGEIIMLLRNVFDKSSNLHKGIWDKSAESSNEVRGKKLGIIGYGNIGSQLSVLAEDLGMEVLYYDLVEKLSLGNAKRCSTLKELLKKSDIITLHIDGRKENTNFISEKEFKQMKDGAIFLNLSRGHVVDLDSLARNLSSKKIRGAAIDVFPEEPLSNSEKFLSKLQNLPNVILTPHIGGSTEEAQDSIANFVPDKIISFINTGNTSFSVNFPNIQLPTFENAHRLIHIHKNVPGILASINSVLSKHNINIIGQYLKTNELIGYVITDIAKKYNPELINELKMIPHTIKMRVLY